MAVKQDRGQERPGIRRASGRGYHEWFALLDGWGAPGRPFREVSDWLREQGLSRWWAQKLIIEYEQARGIRPPGVRPDGTFTVGTSVTVPAPVERLYRAVVEPAERDLWLSPAELRERTARQYRSARYDWAQDGTRVSFTFHAAGDARSRISVEHERLPDSEAARRAKEFWHERLTTLKTMLADTSE